MGARPGSQRKLTLRENSEWKIDLEVPESIDFSEFPASESVEKKHKKHKEKHQKESIRISVQKVDKATQTISKRVWRKIKKKEWKKKQDASLTTKVGEKSYC